MTVHFPELHASPAFSLQRIVHACLMLVLTVVLGACGGNFPQPDLVNTSPETSTNPPVTTTNPPAAPTISSVTPASGKASGGTTVTISGANLTGATGVTFGGAAGTGITVVSSTQLTVITPAGTAGGRDVAVTTAGGTATSAAAYTYVASTISTFAGTSAGLNTPYGTAFDAAGNLYIADSSNHRIRVVCKVSGTYFGVAMTAGSIYTVAGSIQGFAGDGGAPTAARFNVPYHVAFDSSGNLYIADYGNYRIRMVPKANGTYFGVVMTANNIYTVAGTTQGFSGDGGAATSAQMRAGFGIAFDAADNLYIADYSSNRVRMVAKTNGTNFGVAMTANNIYTVAGTSIGLSGDGVAATAAQLSGPFSVTLDAAGNLYIVDSGNHRIRMVPKTDGTYFGVAMTANNIYTVAGSSRGLSGDAGAALAGQLYLPTRVDFDAAGNLYIADNGNSRIRMVNKVAGTYFGVEMTPNNIYTVAGTTSGLSGDGAAPTLAQLRYPNGLNLDASGNLYIADTSNHRIRMVSP